MRWITGLGVAFLVTGGVGCSGGGTPPEVCTTTYLAQGTFAVGDTIPGFALRQPTLGRADVKAKGTWANGIWTVMFTRTLAGTLGGTDDVVFDLANIGNFLYPFGVAVLDNAGGAFGATMQNQNAVPYTMGNAASTANLKAMNATPAGPWDSANWGAVFTKPAGAGIAGTATGAAVTLRAAYDSLNVYLLAVWTDATLDDQKESWVFDGTTWTRRKDKGNDGNWATRDADGSQYDEDRLAIWWNISVTNFASSGCLALCHDHRMGTHTLGQKADLWHWKAARSNPRGFVDDQGLADGTFGGHLMAGRSNDTTGVGIDVGNTTGSPAQPLYMAAVDPGARARYIFLTDTPQESWNSVAFVAGGFNAGAVIPGFRLWAPTGGRADIGAVGTWEAGQWNVMFTRALTTASSSDDRWFDGLAIGTLYSFSVAVLDNAGGAPDATMGSQMSGRHTMGDETLQPTAGLRAKRVTSPPSRNPGDYRWGPVFNKPAGTGIPGTATAAPVAMRAAYDATNFYLLATWSDATKDNFKQSWYFNGAVWARRSDKGTDGSWASIDADGSQWDEDRLAIWWDISAAGFASSGCLALCHDHRMGVHDTTSTADLWHWKAARTNPMGFADDQRLADGTWGDAVPMRGRSDDNGTGIDTGNIAAGLPIYMAGPPGGDPNANARYLFDPSVLPGGFPPVPWLAVAFVPSLPTPVVTCTPIGGGGGGGVSYSQQIDPLFASNCTCHRNGNSQNGLNLDSWANLMAGGNSQATNPEVVAGNGAGSLIYKKVSMDSPPVGARMPFGGPYLSASQQQMIKDWIDQGALNN